MPIGLPPWELYVVLLQVIIKVNNHCNHFVCSGAVLKHGKVLVLYILNHFHDIIFQVDRVWTIRGPSFANLKDKGGLKER